MRVRPTFDSITRGVNATLVQQRNSPALDLVRSPYLNSFYEAAVSAPLQQQAQRVHTAEATENELKQAATSMGIGLHELRAEMKHTREAQMNQEMWAKKADELTKQKIARSHAELSSMIENIDLQLAKDAQRQSVNISPQLRLNIQQGVASGVGPDPINFTPADSDAWRTPGAASSGARTSSNAVLVSPATDDMADAASSGARTSSDVMMVERYVPRTLTFVEPSPPPGTAIQPLSGSQVRGNQSDGSKRKGEPSTDIARGAPAKAPEDFSLPKGDRLLAIKNMNFKELRQLAKQELVKKQLRDRSRTPDPPKAKVKVSKRASR